MLTLRYRWLKSRRGILYLAICFAAAVGSQAAKAQDTDADDLAARLARLEKRIEEAREKEHIPGLAIAVVKDDQVIFAKGFGVGDIESKRPVTPETLFAVGSTTKAFTATIVGMLADESKMNWDDPVEKHIPEFRLALDPSDEKVALRDLLCHRTGFTRMGLLWAGGKLTRPEVLELASTAKPLAKFREKFLYNNVMYMAAGFAAGNAAGSDWESLVAARILKPLNMTNSSTSITVAQQDDRLALGYRWDDDQKDYKLLPMRNLDLIGPAGSINSNVMDMAQWVRFQLGQGKYEGQQLLSSEVHAETWKPQITIAPGVDYGLGWFLRQWNGKKVVEHGGNIDGFAAQVSLLPEHNLGYVLLANVTATPLQSQSIDIVFDSLVGAASEDTATVKDEDVKGLLGKYVAHFGGFRDARFTVLMKDAKLAIDVPGQRVYELKPPDEQGKWYFALTNEIAVSFQQNGKDKANSLTMYQNGFEFECPREGVELQPEVPLKDLQLLVGTYRDEQAKVNAKVIILNNRLTIETPGGEMVPLAPPDDNNTWPMRANKEMGQFRFNKAEDGTIRSMTRIRKGKEVEMPRVADDAADAIPTLDALLKLVRDGYGAEKIPELGNVKLTGTLNFVHQGAQGTVTQVIAGLDKYKSDTDLGKLGYLRAAYDGEHGWNDSSFSPFEELSGSRLKQHRYGHPLWVLQNWSEEFNSATIVQTGEVDGQKVIVLKLAAEGIPTYTLHISAQNGLVLKDESAIIAPGIGQIPATTTYADYRPVNGVMFPFKTVAKTQESGETVTQFEDATTLETVAEDEFRLSPGADQ